ncbi:C40 family peptidase [Virgibacillus pantothenticus]|uniref:Peptidase n=1 Tax=Virgibacillus pantothenticus TaxID=1473 RepID=A0A0L0QML2_VIRPA|nr:C40 family peptidase [Virgibacillus pantothenticus]KNE19842.1 peptidase [Virgibacillus pantothenticus]MED3736032.1 NlpC/P60 family protein [Virgibacillus pantothenticus]QTY14612.1 C40 family peptidase [Virgibacillus pantothenticus]
MLKKSIVTVATVTVVGFSSAFFHTQVQAETLGSLKDKQTEIQNEREAIKADLSKAEAKIADVLIELEELNKQITQFNDAMKENNAQIEKVKADIAKKEQEVDKLEKEIAALEDAIEKRYKKLKERAVSYQKSGGDVSYLEVVLGSKDFGEFINRVSAVNKITNSDAKLLEEQENDKQEVTKKQDKVLKSLEEMEDLQVELEGMQETIKEQKQENEKKEAKLKDKKADLETLKEDLKGEDSNLADLEAEVRQSVASERQPAASANNTPSASTSTSSSPSASVNNDSKDGDLQTLGSKSSSPKAKAKAKAKPSAGSGGVSTIINSGYQHLGTPYVWGGKGPGGFDCSGFVSWAFSQGGYSIPSSTSALVGVGQKISYSEIQPGDLVFFDTYKKNGHVAIYIGGGQFIGAQSTPGVSVESMSNSYWSNAFKGHVRRVL